MPNQAISSGFMINSLMLTLRDGKMGLANAPMLIKRIVADDLWRAFYVEGTGAEVKYDRFIDFVTTKPLEGLGVDLKLIQRLCADDKDALNAIYIATQGKQGGDHTSEQSKVSNRNLARTEKGTTSQYALRKLRKDRPDLHKKVLADELSPHAAMVKAGFRPKTFTVVHETKACAETLKRKFTAKQLQVIIARLSATDRPAS
jgi:hypothetical protein